MNNIIDSIQLSGTVYTLSAQTEGGGVPESTFTAYTASTDSRISIDEEVTAAGLNALNDAIQEKQDQLSAGTNITIVDNVISAEGGGKAIEAGRGISVTTGETADTINCTLPITASTSIRKNDITIGNDIVNGTSDYKRITIGNGNKYQYSNSRTSSSILIATPSSTSSIYNVVKAANCIGIGGDGIEVGHDNVVGTGSIAIGYKSKSIINNSLAIGFNTVASGTTKTNINNQLTIDTSNQVYIYNKDNTEMICLQDQLGGGGTVESAITSGSTNAVESKAIWSATTYNKEVQLQYDILGVTTNYPSGCKKFVVTVPQWSITTICLYNGGNQVGWGNIQVQNNGSPSVSISEYTGITYTIDGTDVTFVIPDSITFDAIQNNNYTIVAVKAIVEGAWVNENTYMKSEVDTIKNNLQSNINAKLDATAYTPTVCDTVLNDVSTNPVQNQALFDELRLYDTGGTSEITLTFNGDNSTNYPTSSRQMIIELGGNASGTITFNSNGGSYVGQYHITYMPQFSIVNISNNLNGSTYELSGSTLTISYPSVSTITSIVKDDTSGLFTSIKSVISGTYTPLIDQVSANTVSIQGKQDKLIAGSGITISGNVISATGGGGEVSTAITSGDTNAVAGGAVYDKFDEVEQVTAAGLNALNDKFDGLKLKKLTQTEYNNLQTKDNNTLYVIVN